MVVMAAHPITYHGAQQQTAYPAYARENGHAGKACHCKAEE
jgi:hypothetical protein